MATDPGRLFISTLFVAAAGALIGPPDVGAQTHTVAYVAGPERAATTSAVRRVWEDRGPITDRDLFWGSGSPDRAPVNPFTFVSEDLAATNPKAVVRDANGATWGVKWDEEVQAEVAATRLAWAMGLGVEETYYVPAGTMRFPTGRPTFQRIGSFIDKTGRFTAGARFERRDPERVSKGTWPFRRNPVMTDPGYSVLILMNVIMGNWDAKDDNTKLVSVSGPGGPVDWYLIGDYGACFGKMGGEFSHSKYRLKDFAASPPVIEENRRVGLNDPRNFFDANGNLKPVNQWTAEMAACVSKIEVAKKNAAAGDTVVTLWFWNKTSALELLSKDLGLLHADVTPPGAAPVPSNVLPEGARVATNSRRSCRHVAGSPHSRVI